MRFYINKINFKIKKNTGITLIEILISAAILSLTIVSLIRLYYLASYQINISRHRIMAVNLATANFETLYELGYSGIVTSDYPLNQNVIIDPGEKDGLSDDLTGTMATQLLNLNSNKGYKFIATITWNEPFGPGAKLISETFETLITDHL